MTKALALSNTSHITLMQRPFGAPRFHFDENGDGGGAGTGGDAGGAGKEGGDVAAKGSAGAGAGAGADGKGGVAGDGKGGAGGDQGGDGKGAQPDWRDQIAGEDKQFRKQLDRLSDLGAVGKKLRSLETKFSSGEYRRSLPDGATAEETATWRKENGVPEKAEDYVAGLKLPDGVVIGEADKPVVAKFAEAAHAGNVDPKAFNGLVAQYYAIQDAQAKQRQEDDAAFKQTSEETLREAWQGAEFRQNMTAINNLMAGWPDGLAASILAGRNPDGRLIGDDPAFIRQMAELARELNPLASLVPAGTTNATSSAEAELAEISKFSRDNPDAYNADKKMQARRLELTEAMQRLKSRAA